MAERELLVRIVGDDRDLQRALRNTEASTARVETRMATFGKTATRAFGAAGIAIGTSAAFAEIQRSVSAASDLNEQITKSREIFGEASKAVEDWSETTATSLGISQRAALTATGTFGGLFSTLGIGEKESAAMSKRLVVLAADLASFNNASPEDALNALRSGLVGEVEPLRRFAVRLSEARVQQVALAETGKKNIKSLTDQEKAYARFHIILTDTVKAQGDVERTSGGLALQQKFLAAQVEDLEASMGQVLIPTITDLVTSLNDAFVVAGKLQTTLGELKALGGIDIPINMPISIILKQGRGKDLKGGLEALKDNIGDALGEAFGAGLSPFKDLLERAQGGGGRGFTFFPGVSERGPERATKDLADKVEKEAKKTGDDAKRIKRARERQREAFAEFQKGLGLKLETAGLDSAQAELTVLREIERSIEKQIAREGRTFKLQQQLIRVRGDIQNKLADIASEQEKKETAKVKEVADKAKDEREKRKRIREQARADRQKDLLEDLGLTREGDKPTPGAGSLLRRAKSLQDQVQGTPLDTPKTNQQLRRIISVLKKNFKTAGKDVRAAILDMLNDISSAFEGKGPGAKKGPLTSTHGLATNQIIKNLGLTVEQAEQIQRRLAHATVGGNVSRAIGSGPPARTASSTGRDGRIFVESHTTINLDGQQIASAVTRQQQKTKRRNPKQKRGPNRR